MKLLKSSAEIIPSYKVLHSRFTQRSLRRQPLQTTNLTFWLWLIFVTYNDNLNLQQYCWSTASEMLEKDISSFPEMINILSKSSVNCSNSLHIRGWNFNSEKSYGIYWQGPPIYLSEYHILTSYTIVLQLWPILSQMQFITFYESIPLTFCHQVPEMPNVSVTQKEIRHST